MNKSAPPPPSWDEMKHWPPAPANLQEKMNEQFGLSEQRWEEGDLTPYERILLRDRGAESLAELSPADRKAFLRELKIPEKYWPTILAKAQRSAAA